MHTRITVGLVLGISLTLVAGVFGGCSGWTQDGPLVGTDPGVTHPDRPCVLVYENSPTVDGVPYEENAPDGYPCNGGLGKCSSGVCDTRNDVDAAADGTSDAPYCTTDTECPHIECSVGKCKNGSCTQEATSNGTCNIITNGANSQNGICVEGKCKECTSTNVSQCPQDDNSTPYCNPKHECVTCSNLIPLKCPFCNNKMKDGTETGIDCGNDACGKCNGEPCTFYTKCASDHCVDGYCCNSACDGTCMTCAGSAPGACSAVEDGLSDDTCPKGPIHSSFCFGTSANSTDKRCYFEAETLCPPDGLGADPSQCMSGECGWRDGSYVCLPGAGDKFCAVYSDCESNVCSTKNRCVGP